MKNKAFVIILAVLIALLAFMFFIFNTPRAGEWVCQNGQWVKQGQTDDSKPQVNCPLNSNDQDIAEQIDLSLDYPTANEIISSPLVVTGKARGGWYFEADFPVSLLDANGKLLAQAPAMAQGEWMTEDFVNFRAELDFTQPETLTGILVLERANPSGLAEMAEEIRIPVKFSQLEQQAIKLYFGNSIEDPNVENCESVYSVARQIEPTTAVASTSLRLLIAGPTQAEQVQGYFSSINSETEVNSIIVENGVAKVDFSSTIESGGSCRVQAIRSQIVNTLIQFSTVDEVIISVDGNVEEALQP